MKFEIKHRFNGSVLFSLETESLKICVQAAVKSNANLHGADLRGANLHGANLSGADLRGADLSGANLSGANLHGANLHGAHLHGANLHGAHLRGANLRDANLRDAHLRGANLHGAKIRDDITISKVPIQISGLAWLVTIWDEHMQIGCEFHSHDEWRNFDDAEWLKMGGKEALYLKREQFPMLIALCDQHKLCSLPEVLT